MGEQGLADVCFQPLPLGSIRPKGWLRNQLRIQLEGLTGHLDEFWPDVADSQWIGGNAEGWERGPYWLDGAVPLAFLLDDGTLKGKVTRWMDYILDHQQEDGWLGPDAERYKSDPWPIALILKCLVQVHEATSDARSIPAMMRCCRNLDERLDRHPLSRWAAYRWPDLSFSLYWLYERTGEKWLLQLADRASRQGYDWRAHFADLPYKGKRDKWAFGNHVVNHAMAVKTAGVLFRRTGRPDDAALARVAVEAMDRYHGQATGIFTGDESLAGLMPSQGTELCAVVEYLFSLEVLMSVLGEPWLGDRLEKIAFNAMPATFKPDMWAHQYDQQANQVVCAVTEDRLYTNNGPDANLFGLEPNFGCCTANMHQGWPKFASHLWMRTQDSGLAAAAYAPCEVSTEISGAAVRIDVETDYPFDETIRVTVHAERPIAFPLLLRIPSWADAADVSIDSGDASPVEAGRFHRIEREWRDETAIILRVPMPVRTQTRFNSSVAIERGPLVYSLKIGEEWKRINEDVPGRELPHGDWEVHPTTPWNYALQINPESPADSIEFESRGMTDCPFSPEGAPVRATVKGKRVPEWGIEDGAAAPPPTSPVAGSGDLESLALIPYGCTNLRVTEFPVLA